MKFTHRNRANQSIEFAGTGAYDGMIEVTHGISSVVEYVYANDTTVITGTTTANMVVVDGVKANITLRDVNIQINANSFDTTFEECCSHPRVFKHD